jgi:adenylylsulfate kinase
LPWYPGNRFDSIYKNAIGILSRKGFITRIPDSAQGGFEVTNEDKAKNIVWHNTSIAPWEYQELHGHKGVTIWFTGLPSSGKSTLANAVARELMNNRIHTIVLDGDNIRHGLNRNLGFSETDRQENIRRIAEVAKLFTQTAIVTLTAFVSPYRSDRNAARALQPESFIEVYCKAPVEVCEKRDPKGLYKKARAGEIKGFTGIDDPYEPPEHPEILLPTGNTPVVECANTILNYLTDRGIINIKC